MISSKKAQEKVKTLAEETASIRAIAKEQPNVSLNNLEDTLKELHSHMQKLSSPEVKQVSKYQPLTKTTGNFLRFLLSIGAQS